MEVRFRFDDCGYREYYIEERIDNQSLLMAFQEVNDGDVDDTIYFNVYLVISSKRKHRIQNESNKIITGKNPIQDVIIARKGFDAIESDILKDWSKKKDIVIYCHWIDNRRRDAYYKILSKKGYTYQNINGKKVIAKRFKRELK